MVVRGYLRGLKRQNREAAHSPQSNAEVKNTQSCTSTPCIRLRDMVSVKESLHAAYSCPFKEWHPWTLWRMTLIYILGLYKSSVCRGQLKCDGTHAETRFRLSGKRTSPYKSAGASVQSTTGSRDVRISGSNAGYTKFRGSVKGTGYPLNSPVSPSLPLPCVTVCHHISTGVYFKETTLSCPAT